MFWRITGFERSSSPQSWPRHSKRACPRRSPKRILAPITTPLGPTLLPEFLERQLTLLFAQEAQEPLVVPRVDVEQPRDEPVVATRRFEPPSNHLAQRAAREFAIHVRR